MFCGGVLVQHLNGYAYTDLRIFYSVWWVVALFVMIGGYNAMASYLNRGVILVKSKLLRLFKPYLLATVLYLLRLEHFLDAELLLERLIHFNAVGPLYYVAVYMQLILITPVLVGLIRWCDQRNCLVRYLTVWVFVLFVCYGTIHYTNLFGIMIGGGNLFAGVWLFFWFLGMLIKNREFCPKNRTLRIWAFVVNTACLAVWQYLFVFRAWNLKLERMFRGGGAAMTWANAVETVLIFFWFRDLMWGFETITGKAGKRALKLINFLGRHTLYIFLYHILFLGIYKDYLEFGGKMNRWICFVFIFLCPILLEGTVKQLKKIGERIIRGLVIV